MASHDTITTPLEAVSDTNPGAPDDILAEENGAVMTQPSVGEEKKKKKKKSKSRKNKRKAATGFEDFFADSPMGPEEAAEERELYSQNRLFIDRIEECIQRYRAKRKFDNEQTAMFNKYMFLGGVDSEQRQFTGIASDIEAMAQMEDKAELRLATARDFVGGCGSRFYEAGSDDWVVDFEGIVKGFLSRTMTELYQYDAHANEKAAGVVKNFLNYVLMHDVCPEYTTSILAARHICDIAPTELNKAHELSNLLPGMLHEALVALFVPCTSGNIITPDVPDISRHMELAVFALSTCSGMEHMARAIKHNRTGCCIVPVVSGAKEEAYKIIDIRRPKRDERDDFIRRLSELTLTNNTTATSCTEDEEITISSPLGTLTLRKTYLESGYDNVPCSDGDSDSENDDADSDLGIIQVLLEDDLLSLCEIGMKLQLAITELTFPSFVSSSSSSSQDVLRIITNCADVRVTFDKFLPQMLMEKWREPVGNTRPPPSVADPHAEEGGYDNGDI